MIGTGFAEAVRGRLFGPRKELASVTIAALEREYAGVTPLELAPYDYRPAQGQAEAPTFRMSKQAIEITKVPGASKAKGEVLTAHFVFTPAAGPDRLMVLSNTQTEEEIGPGGNFRFAFSPVAATQVFMDTGKGVLYAKASHDAKASVDAEGNGSARGAGGASGQRRWVYGVEVSCFVPATMRDLTPSA